MRISTSVISEKQREIKNFSPCVDQFKRADNETEMFVGRINIYHVKVFSFVCDEYKQSSLLYSVHIYAKVLDAKNGCDAAVEVSNNSPSSNILSNCIKSLCVYCVCKRNGSTQILCALK